MKKTLVRVLWVLRLFCVATGLMSQKKRFWYLRHSPELSLKDSDSSRCLAKKTAKTAKAVNDFFLHSVTIPAD
jgi:hypothetical protein